MGQNPFERALYTYAGGRPMTAGGSVARGGGGIELSPWVRALESAMMRAVTGMDPKQGPVDPVDEQGYARMAGERQLLRTIMGDDYREPPKPTLNSVVARRMRELADKATSTPDTGMKHSAELVRGLLDRRIQRGVIKPGAFLEDILGSGASRRGTVKEIGFPQGTGAMGEPGTPEIPAVNYAADLPESVAQGRYAGSTYSSGGRNYTSDETPTAAANLRDRFLSAAHVPPEIRAAEELYTSGHYGFTGKNNDIGVLRRSAVDIAKLHPDYPDFQKALRLSANLAGLKGAPIFRRAMPEYAEALAEGYGTGPQSFTTNPSTAEMMTEMSTPQDPRRLTAVSLLRPKSLVIRGNPGESEVIADASAFNPSNTRLFTPTELQQIQRQAENIHPGRGRIGLGDDIRRVWEAALAGVSLPTR